MALSKDVGLAGGCDIAAIKPYWSNAKNILDVSAGFGRAVSALLQFGYAGQITAIERDAGFCRHMKHGVGEKIQVIQEDIRNLKLLDHKYDLILLLWSSIADFPASEQASIVKKIAALRSESGHIAIDTSPIGVFPPHAVAECGPQTYVIQAKHSVVRIYRPSQGEISRYAEQAGLQLVEMIPYKTDTNRDRILYIIG